MEPLARGNLPLPLCIAPTVHIMNNNVERFTFGITRAWQGDGTIVVIDAGGDMQREAVDQLMKLIIDTVKQTSTHDVIRIVLDFTHPDRQFTPYSWEQLEATFQEIDRIEQTYIAVVVNDPLMFRFTNLLSRRHRRTYDRITEQVFTTKSEALNWLQEMNIDQKMVGD